jgi:hypothetical protein
VVAKADALLRQAIQRRHVVTGGNWQVEPRLFTYYQNHVQRAVRWPRRRRGVGPGDAARRPGVAVYCGGRHGARGGTETE